MAGSISPIDGVGIVDNVFPRNIGAIGVQAFPFSEVETATGRGLNDSIARAQFLPLGTGPGQQNTIDVSGALPLAQANGGLNGTLPEDVDFFAMDLRAGDILDIAGIGSIGRFDVLYSTGTQWFGTIQNTSAGGTFYPANSPLQTLGNVVAAQIVPETGRYYIRLATSGIGTNYTLGLRVYRPFLESQPIGTQQTLFLDFDGGIFPASLFGLGITPGQTIILPSLVDSLNNFGFNIPLDATPEADAITNTLIDEILVRVHEDFNLFVPQFGGNGNFNATGIAGQFGIRILNSRDHADPGFFAPNVTRVFVGGSGTDVLVGPNSGLYGVSQSVDIGNFDTSEFVFTILDTIATDALTIPVAFGANRLQIAAQGIALTISHEAGHSFGLLHTDRAGGIPSIIDANVGIADDYELGPDGIFGTADDVNIPFPNRDRFNPVEGYIGFQRVAANLAWALATGTVGSAVTGTVFNDLNRDGRISGTGETGVGGVTVFVDRNANGVLDPGETSTITAANGTYSLPVGLGTARIIAIPPSSFISTSSAQTVTVNNGGVSNVNHGLGRVSADITGRKWADLNGNGFMDDGEPGIPGVFIYLDLDGDDRIDIGEPRGITDANGNYTINFPGPGTYTIREVVDPGFIQTFPANGEHFVVFSGASLGNNFNFGNLPSLDFGDAPDSYRTTLAAGGPSHGILVGLSLGSTPDRELDGAPSVGADGDDNAGFIGAGGTIVDDEDGVRLLTPIGPGAVATFEVNLTNTTSQTGFLQAWFDFNQNGTFSDPGEQVIVDATRAPGVNLFNIPIPATVTPGPLYTRWRYSLTPGLGIGGQANAGEVEDHLFTIQPSAQLANDDLFSVTRNSQSNILNVLANDFETNGSTLRVTAVSQSTAGVRPIVANGQRAVLYTPPLGFTGRDTFTYQVTSTTGETATATVVVNVSFLSNVPIAIDDSFEVAEGSNSIALNVLDNDIPSQLGGVTIISVTPGSAGGTTSLAGGNQSVRYTPRPGFNGTEEFTYSISDTAGNISSAKATINLLPGSRNDDLVAFSVGFFEATNNTPITNVQVGQEFLVRVTVEDLRQPQLINRGVFSAFLDLLYTDELVSVVADPNNPDFNFNIVFGNQFQSEFNLEVGDADTPGLINDVGSQRPLGILPTAPEGPIELFTLRMQAVSPGIAVFASNPADDPINETTLFNSQTAVTVAQQRLGFGEIVISPAGQDFTSAIDDSFPNSIDSLGQQIRSGVQSTLRVTDNDNLGPSGVITDFAILTLPTLGTAIVGPNNTILYTPNLNANGFDSFTYAIVTADGVRSSAQVTLTVGDAAADDLMAIDLRVVDGAGNPITGSIAPGSRFGLQVIVDDLRSPLAANPLGVFAAFADILYSSNVVRPSNTITSDNFNFDVVFGPEFGVVGAFGTADRLGLIDEFGSFLTNSNPSNNPPNPALTGEPVLLATLFFDAIGTGPVQFTAGPADSLPFRESLLFEPAEPVPFSRIRYGVASVTIGSTGEAEARQNAVNPADVNDDGIVSPLDALMVINELGRLRSGEGESLASRVLRFTDVTGDGRVTPLDALQVINTMSRRNRNASPSDSEDVPLPTVVVNDYRTLDEIRARRAAAFSLASSVAAPVPEGFGSGTDDDSDDDILDLIAGDIGSVWQ